MGNHNYQFPSVDLETVGSKHFGVLKLEDFTYFGPSTRFPDLGHMDPLETIVGYALIPLVINWLRTWA